MNAITVSAHAIHQITDTEGFLLDVAIWNREAAQLIAKNLGISALTSEHWAAISCVRERYRKYRSLTPARVICGACGFDQGAIKTLFGGYKNLWRIAGLPDPGEEARAYMD